MKKEVVILAISWLLVIILYIGKVPRDVKGKAHISFLFAQTLSWIYIFYSVYFKRIEFPFREFPYATKLSFSLHYMIYPAFAMFFELTYPKSKSVARIILHYVLFAGMIELYAFLIGHYTELAKPLKWGYLNIMIYAVLLLITHHFVSWFEAGKRYN
ncbi:CBO0543 family protein [Priestia filamentosa]|uniref:CBO0543 family protein n=1 Tax=Priestia filamentosa TaxID=1402861 RepID=UPI0002F7C76F|nr:CBO0543 family protein [Priestia filamentosa]